MFIVRTESFYWTGSFRQELAQTSHPGGAPDAVVRAQSPGSAKEYENMCPDLHRRMIGGEMTLERGEQSLSQRILDFVTEHPGVKLIVIEEALGVSRIEVGRTIRELMDQGKIRRDEDTREYFPF